MKTMALVLVALATLAGAPSLVAQTTPLASWPVCKLGAAPIYPGPAPVEATVFLSPGGPVVMSEAGQAGAVRWIRCRLAVGAPSYRGADGVLRDVASNQPYFPVGWDASPPRLAEKGDSGANGRGIAYSRIVRDSLFVTYTDSTTENVGRVTGLNGSNGRTPVKGIDYDDGAKGADARIDLWPCNNSRWWRAGCWTALAGLGLVAKNNLPHHHDSPPRRVEEVTTLPICTHLPCS